MIKGIEQLVSKVFQEQYGEAPIAESIQIQETRKDFEGDFVCKYPKVFKGEVVMPQEQKKGQSQCFEAHANATRSIKLKI